MSSDGEQQLRPTDVVLHPVRMRIVRAFLGDRQLTTGDLRAEIPDVPSATLYRQVAALAQGGVLDVVDEKRVRGAVERTYRLRAGAAYVDTEGARQMTVEEHRQVFLTFTIGLLADFDHYLDHCLDGGGVDLARDLVGYQQNALYLTDRELETLIGEMQAVLAPRLAQTPAPGRTRRLLTTVLMPDPADPAEPEVRDVPDVPGRAADSQPASSAQE